MLWLMRTTSNNRGGFMSAFLRAVSPSSASIASTAKRVNARAYISAANDDARPRAGICVGICATAELFDAAASNNSPANDRWRPGKNSIGRRPAPNVFASNVLRVDSPRQFIAGRWFGSGRCRRFLAVGLEPAVDQGDAAVDLGMAQSLLAGDQ